MADDTDREALARLIAGGDRYLDGSVVMDSHWREFHEAAERVLTAGYVSPSRHRAEVEAAWKAARDAAAAKCRERARDDDRAAIRWASLGLRATAEIYDAVSEAEDACAEAIASLTPPAGGVEATEERTPMPIIATDDSADTVIRSVLAYLYAEAGIRARMLGATDEERLAHAGVRQDIRELAAHYGLELEQ